jgi:hypothetical protein
MASELVDDDQAALPHIIERSVIDHIERGAAAKARQKRQARFGRAGAKDAKAIGADLRGVAALAGVARARIVDRDIGAAQSRFQHSLILGAKRLQLGRQQANDLSLRNHHPHAGEKRDDPLAGHLPSKVKHQYGPMQVGAITPHNAGGEVGQDRLTVRRLPSFAPITRHLRVQAQILNDDVFIAFVARAGWSFRLHHDRRANGQLVELAAASARRTSALVAASLRPSCILSFSDRSRVTSPIKSRTTPISSEGVTRSSESGSRGGIRSLNHIFQTMTPPSARESAPVTYAATNPLKTNIPAPKERGDFYDEKGSMGVAFDVGTSRCQQSVRRRGPEKAEVAVIETHVSRDLKRGLLKSNAIKSDAIGKSLHDHYRTSDSVSQVSGSGFASWNRFQGTRARSPCRPCSCYPRL